MADTDGNTRLSGGQRTEAGLVVGMGVHGGIRPMCLDDAAYLPHKAGHARFAEEGDAEHATAQPLDLRAEVVVAQLVRHKVELYLLFVQLAVQVQHHHGDTRPHRGREYVQHPRRHQTDPSLADCRLCWRRRLSPPGSSATAIGLNTKGSPAGSNPSALKP